jgi:hypothetical protein
MLAMSSVSRPDEETQAEVELCTTLMIASSGSDHLLTQNEVDQLLGVPSRP